MNGMLIFHRALWVIAFGLSWLAVSCGLLFLMSGNPHVWRALKFFGVGAIMLAFLASWL
jgi:hypothetical protein